MKINIVKLGWISYFIMVLFSILCIPKNLFGINTWFYFGISFVSGIILLIISIKVIIKINKDIKKKYGN